MPCNCQDVAEKGKQKVEESLAMRLVQDTRKQSKRWFVAWLVTFLALLAVLSGIVYVVLTSDIAVDNNRVSEEIHEHLRQQDEKINKILELIGNEKI